MESFLQKDLTILVPSNTWKYSLQIPSNVEEISDKQEKLYIKCTQLFLHIKYKIHAFRMYIPSWRCD